MTDHLRMYRVWFYTAAMYNVAWGAAVIAFPVPLSRLAGLEVATVIPLVQVIGMMVGVYAIGKTGGLTCGCTRRRPGGRPWELEAQSRGHRG